MSSDTPTVPTRRTLLKLAGAGLVAGAAGLPGTGRASASPILWRRPSILGSGDPTQLHVTYGADPATQMTVSWATDAAVVHPSLTLGTPGGGPGSTFAAQTRTYTAAATATMAATEVTTQHVQLSGLLPGTTYVYTVTHHGASTAIGGTFTTPPRGRFPFRFSSFGDQGTGNPNDFGFTPQAIAIVDHINRAQPLFQLYNGDLAYSDLQQSTARAWADFFINNMPSTANIPWMPSLGNHENETGNGPQGFASYLTRYLLPDNGVTDFAGNWYTFRVGSVCVISLDADDVVYQDSGNFYIHGYSGGAQKAWLRRTLAAARADAGIDWIVVFQHMAVISSSASGNGCDLGLRQEFQPLFDEFDVDLVLCGHEHDYERSYSLKGFEPASATMRPRVVATATDVIDATLGTVYLVLGGGGFALPTNDFTDTAGNNGTGNPDTATAKVNIAKGTTATEVADWSYYRDAVSPYGFATFDVDPGAPGGLTSITVRYFHTTVVGAAPLLVESFVLQRPRADATPAAALPEVPRAILLPATGLVLAAGGAALARRHASDAG